ncbi:MAG TPA: hypothetical protein VE442_18880 [Jatrophihabitans sp.]|jgi:hypothetical protein|nr:hypothetical protein [Jatrophihabitans sp.]
MDVETPQLGPITIGMGAGDGFSASDLTNPRLATLAGEVPYLALDGSTRSADPVLELRIHGVGGAPAADNLETPATIQVAGDETAGFYRAWYPGGSAAGQPRREAYGWGGLNTRATARAFYLLLIAFMLINMAHWALPGRPGKQEPLTNKISRAVLRLIGLAVTVAFFATTVTLLADLVAWQAAPRGGLPSWLGWYARRDTGPRLAVALLLVLVVLGGLIWLSFRTVRDYEKWGTEAFTEQDEGWLLTHARFWRGERSVNRQRNVHVIAASAVVLFFAALPDSSANPVRVVLLVVAAALGAAAIGLAAAPWADRLHLADQKSQDQQWSEVLVMWAARFAVAVAAGASLARFWWRPGHDQHALPGDQLMLICVTFAEFGLVVLLTAVVAMQAPWRARREVMGFGLVGPLLALLAVTVGTIFGTSLTLAVSNLIGTPKVTTSDPKVVGETLLLPSTVYSGSVGMIVAVLALVGVAAYLAGWANWEGRRLGGFVDNPAQHSDSVQAVYASSDRRDAGAALAVGKIWARSALTDRLAGALAVLAIPTAALFVADLIALQLGANPKFLQKVATIGGTIGVFVTLYFLTTLRAALLSASKRRHFGFLWDVGTFWPRACHPFGPPSYAERTIPEVVTRVRRLVGDQVRGGTDDPALAQQDAEQRHASDVPLERHSPVLLTGYSQGTPISIAVMAQLPADVRSRLSLLTLAAPIRRLYGRAFPAYFGPDQLAKVRGYLADERGMRWRNLVRRSDYIGGCAFDPGSRREDHNLVDFYINDPPTLWDSDNNPSPPELHMHADWFPDPQVRPYAVQLANQLSDA